MTTKIIMADRDIGPGERASRARSRRIMTTIGALVLGGFILGLVAAFVEREVPGGIGTFPPAFSVGAVLMYLALVGGGCWRYYRSIDELELKNNYVGGLWGINVYMTIYPCWWLLWKGGMVPEPLHEVVFVITFVSTMIAYFWHKFRF